MTEQAIAVMVTLTSGLTLLLVGGIGTVLWFAVRRHVTRIDEHADAIERIQSEKADRTELIDVVRQINTNAVGIRQEMAKAREDADQSRGRLYDALRVAVENQADTNVAVASELGEMRGAIAHAGGKFPPTNGRKGRAS